MLIGKVPLFAALPRSEIEHMAATLRGSAVEPGAILFQEGDYGDRFYIVLDGQIEIVKALGTTEERLLAVRGAGEFIGEMSLFQRDGLRTASGRSRSAAQLLEMSRTDFDALLHRQPMLAYEMVRVLSIRLRESDDATIRDLQEKNRQLTLAYQELQDAHEQIIEKEKLEHELQVARELQMRMLPRALPQLPGCDFGARIVPARAVSGDFFDFIPLGPDSIGIIVGDVCGKGLPAALFMALTRSLLRVEASRPASTREVLQSANRHLLDMTDSGLFVTLIYGIVDRATRTFTYTRAGHELPMLFDAHGTPIMPGRGQGQPLGILADPDLDTQTLMIPLGGTLLLYTDGVTEAMDGLGGFFEVDRLQKAVQANHHVSAQALCDLLVEAVEIYRGAAPQHDDVTLVALHMR